MIIIDNENDEKGTVYEVDEVEVFEMFGGGLPAHHLSR
jgi:hypothetical protein